jgi:hypothetical protein
MKCGLTTEMVHPVEDHCSKVLLKTICWRNILKEDNSDGVSRMVNRKPKNTNMVTGMVQALAQLVMRVQVQ